MTCTNCEILSQRVDGHETPYGVRLCPRHGQPEEVLQHLKAALSFLDEHLERPRGGIYECNGVRFYYDDALALVNAIERGVAA